MPVVAPDLTAPRMLGRYAIHGEIAAGGMATVHLGRLVGAGGFSRTVAIKRLHPQYAKDPDFVAMFLDEARLAVRIQHPNVAQVLDVVAEDGELFMVMEYLHGESVSRLLRRWAKPVPLDIASSIASSALHGLHAAHEATNERGEPLGIVHRDVSPQNLFVGRDGVTRVLDFGVAKASGRFHTTEDGRVKGKLAYMPPEQIRGQTVSRQTDVYAAAVVLWELLTGRRFVQGDNPGQIVERVLYRKAEAPSEIAEGIPAEIDRIVLRGLERSAAKRFATAHDMALALEAAAPPALSSRVGAWVESIVGADLSRRSELLQRVESDSDSREMKHLMNAVLSRPEPVEPLTPAPAAKKSRRWAVLAAALALAALGAVGLVAARRAQTPAPTTSPVTTAEPEVTVRATASELPSPPPVASSALPAPVAAPVPTRATAPAVKRPKPSKVSCNPPYTVDKNGVRLYKMECL